LLASVLATVALSGSSVAGVLPLWAAGTGAGQLLVVISALRVRARRRSVRRRGLAGLSARPVITASRLARTVVVHEVVVHDRVREQRPA